MRKNKKNNFSNYTYNIPFYGNSSYGAMFEVFKQLYKPRFATKKSNHELMVDFLSYNYNDDLLYCNYTNFITNNFANEQEVVENKDNQVVDSVNENEETVDAIEEELDAQQVDDHDEDEIIDVQYSKKNKPVASLEGMVKDSYKEVEEGVFDVDFDEVLDVNQEDWIRQYEERFNNDYNFGIFKNEQEFIEDQFSSEDIDTIIDNDVQRVINERKATTRKVSLNYVDDNSGRLVISDHLAVQKYKQAGFNNLSDEEKKRIFLPTTLADPEAFQKCDKIKVIHHFDQDIVAKQIETNEQQLKKSLDALRYVENNYNAKGKKILGLAEVNQEIDDDLKIYNSVVQNVKFDWYKKHIREDYYQNHDNSFVAPNFSDSVLEPSLEEVIYDNNRNELDPYIVQIESINNLLQIEEHIKMIKSTSVIQWTNNKDSNLLFRHLIFAKSNVDLLLKELLAGVSVIFEQLFLQKTSWIMKSKRQEINNIFEKNSSIIKSEIARFSKFKDTLSNQNIKILKSFDETFKDVVSNLKEVLEKNNIKDIFSARIGYIIKLRKLFNDNISNIEFLLGIDPYIVSKTIINLPDLIPNIEQELWFTLAEYKQLFITIANFSKVDRKHNDKWTKRDLLNFFNRIKSCYKFINGTLSIIKTNVLETKIMIEEGKIDPGVFVPASEELISTILLLEEDFSKINITDKEQTNTIIKRVSNTWQVVAKKIMSFPCVETTHHLFNLRDFISVANKLVMSVINKILETVKDWKITSKIAQKINVDINYELASKFDLSIGLEYLDTRVQKTYCSICDLEHKNPMFDDSSLIVPDDYVNLKNYINSKLLRITKDYVLEAESEIAHSIFKEVVRYKNTHRGIISSLYRIIEFIDGDLTDLYIRLIMADLIDDFESRRDEVAAIYYEIVKKMSFRLYILKHVHQQANILNIFEERIAKFSPNLSTIVTWDNIITSINNDVVSRINNLYWESKQQDDDVNYFYCELVKEGLLNPQEINKTDEEVAGAEQSSIIVDADDEYLSRVDELFRRDNVEKPTEISVIGLEIIDEEEWEDGTRPTGTQLQVYDRRTAKQPEEDYVPEVSEEQPEEQPQPQRQQRPQRRQEPQHDIIEVERRNVDKNIIQTRTGVILPEYIHFQNVEPQVQLEPEVTPVVEEKIEQPISKEPIITTPPVQEPIEEQPNESIIRQHHIEDESQRHIDLSNNDEPENINYFSFDLKDKEQPIEEPIKTEEVIFIPEQPVEEVEEPQLEQAVEELIQEEVSPTPIEVKQESKPEPKDETKVIVKDGEDILVSEFHVDTKPSIQCEYKDVLEESKNNIVQKVKFVDPNKYKEYLESSDTNNKNIPNFLNQLEKERTKIFFDVSKNDNYIVKDSWSFDEFNK